MSTEAPPTLQELSMQILLRNQALAVSSVDSLPPGLFLQLFKEAFACRSTDILKAMVQTWPFPCLPLGTMMKTRDLRTLRIALDGVDMLLVRQVRPRRCKLQVLDLRKEQQDVWTKGYMAIANACSAEDLTDQGAAIHGAGMVAKQPMRVFIDICIHDLFYEDEFQAPLLRWAKKRKDFLQLCCMKLHIRTGSIYRVQEVLHAVQLEHIQELKVDDIWNQRIMMEFVPYLSRMSNLRVFSFNLIRDGLYPYGRRNPCRISLIIYLFKMMEEANRLRVHHDFFPFGKLHEALRSQTPLEILSLRSTPLKLSDLRHLSQCPSTSQLKYLHLQDCSLKDLRLELLGALLETLAGTLESLLLEECEITDSQLDAILPALSCCSQLTMFSFFGNRISMVALENLLRHTARLSQLRRALYPAPLESYDPDWDTIDSERFAQVRVKLGQVLRNLRPRHNVQIGTFVCLPNKRYRFSSLEPSGTWTDSEECCPPSVSTCTLCPFYVF